MQGLALVAFTRGDASREGAAFRERFSKLSLDWWARALPDFDLFQIFVRDPDGLTLELNFNGLNPMPDWGEDYSKMPEVAGAKDKAGTITRPS